MNIVISISCFIVSITFETKCDNKKRKPHQHSILCAMYKCRYIGYKQQMNTTILYPFTVKCGKTVFTHYKSQLHSKFHSELWKNYSNYIWLRYALTIAWYPKQFLSNHHRSCSMYFQRSNYYCFLNTT